MRVHSFPTEEKITVENFDDVLLTADKDHNEDLLKKGKKFYESSRNECYQKLSEKYKNDPTQIMNILNILHRSSDNITGQKRKRDDA